LYDELTDYSVNRGKILRYLVRFLASPLSPSLITPLQSTFEYHVVECSTLSKPFVQHGEGLKLKEVILPVCPTKIFLLISHGYQAMSIM